MNKSVTGKHTVKGLECPTLPRRKEWGGGGLKNNYVYRPYKMVAENGQILYFRFLTCIWGLWLHKNFLEKNPIFSRNAFSKYKVIQLR